MAHHVSGSPLDLEGRTSGFGFKFSKWTQGIGPDRLGGTEPVGESGARRAKRVKGPEWGWGNGLLRDLEPINTEFLRTLSLVGQWRWE